MPCFVNSINNTNDIMFFTLDQKSVFVFKGVISTFNQMQHESFFGISVNFKNFAGLTLVHCNSTALEQTNPEQTATNKGLNTSSVEVLTTQPSEEQARTSAEGETSPPAPEQNTTSAPAPEKTTTSASATGSNATANTYTFMKNGNETCLMVTLKAYFNQVGW